jgi:hypothetical protein
MLPMPDVAKLLVLLMDCKVFRKVVGDQKIQIVENLIFFYPYY